LGVKRDEVRGVGRKLHNVELHNFYSSRSVIRMMQSRRMRLAGHVARTGRRGMHIGYWCESQKRPLGRPRRRWIILKWILEIGWGGMDWIDLALVNTVMIQRGPYNAGKFLSSCTIGGFSRQGSATRS
jgi:hypothetical protein